MTEDKSLRATFNLAAQDYDAARPGYPARLFEDVVAFSEMPPRGQALEIGCGTGQATLPFAQRGYRILCLDIGADLLALAAHNLRSYPDVRFENVSFESWPVQGGVFDLVYAATAFHWIPPEVGYPKASQALRPGGTLAIFAHIHPRPFTGFFEEVQSIYRRYLPELLPRPDQPDTAAAIAAQAEAIRATGLFSRVEVRTYPWAETYTTDRYLRLLNTYSWHHTVPQARRDALYQAIADLIESRYGGEIERPYLTELYLGKTLPAAPTPTAGPG